MLDKQVLASALENALRSAEPGQDSVAQVCAAMAAAFDAYVKSGTVEVTSSGGGCTYAGTHPPLSSTGSVK